MSPKKNCFEHEVYSYSSYILATHMLKSRQAMHLKPFYNLKFSISC